MDLPEDDPATFEYILDYVLDTSDNFNYFFQLSEDDNATPYASQMAWCKIFILANKMDLCGAERNACDSFYNCFCFHTQSYDDYGVDFWTVSLAAAKFLYDNTTETARLREQMAATAVEAYEKHGCLSAKDLKKW